MNPKCQIEYIDPKEITEDKFVYCSNYDLFLESTHFTRIPKKDDPDTDRVLYFIEKKKFLKLMKTKRKFKLGTI